MWDLYIRDNLNKLLDRGHRVLTVAQFAALTSPEGTRGSVAPDEVYLEVDATNGVVWHLAYESSETTYKWRWIGGPPLWSEVTTFESTTSTTYTSLATAGPSVTLPRSGDYDVQHGSHNPEVTGVSPFHSYDIGGTPAVDADALGDANLGNRGGVFMRRRRKTGLGAVALVSKYKLGAAGTRGWSQRWMAVTPVRIRHDA